jgi:hypothetical protein
MVDPAFILRARRLRAARGLALTHLDATLRRNDAAARFLAGDV